MKFNYKHVIWDWNGTLINDTWLCLEIINRVLERRGIQGISINIYMQYFDFPVRDFYTNIGLDFSKESFDLLADEFITEYNRRCIECSLHSGVKDILSSFQNAGLRQAILSASQQVFLREAVEYYSLRPFFEKVYGVTDHYANGKLELAEELLEVIGLSKDHVVLIGDTIHDYEVARSIGIDCILICGGHQNRKRLEACNVPVLESITEINRK